MSYADFDYYKNEFLGVEIAEADFNRLSLRASETIDFQTLNQASSYFLTKPAPIKKCTCAIAEILYKEHRNDASSHQNSPQGLIKSESAGDESYSYQVFDSMGEAGQKIIAHKIRNILHQYLLPTGLLYRGGQLC